jgi:hypothetical protein
LQQRKKALHARYQKGLSIYDARLGRIIEKGEVGHVKTLGSSCLVSRVGHGYPKKIFFHFPSTFHDRSREKKKASQLFMTDRIPYQVQTSNLFIISISYKLISYYNSPIQQQYNHESHCIPRNPTPQGHQSRIF